MTLLNENKEIIIDSNITLENTDLNIEIDIDDFKIKKVEMVSNYKIRLNLENNSGDRGWSYITAMNDSIRGRNILTKLLVSSKIVNIPLGVLPKLDLNYF